MSKRPLVSVIVPTWNRARQLRRAIDSLLAQTYGSVEIVVVDDGSTDETSQTLEDYRGRITAIRQDNRGASAARNAGIRASTGEMIGFLDSDDEWDSQKVSEQAALLEAAGTEAVLAIANSRELWETGVTLESFEANRFTPPAARGILENPSEIMLSRFLLFNPNVLVRREALFAAGLFDESLAVLEDYALALRLSLAGRWCYTTRTLATIHRGAPGSLTMAANRDKRVAQGCLVRILESMRAGGYNLSPRESRLLEMGLSRARRRLSWAVAGGPSRMAALWDRISLAVWLRSPMFPSPVVREPAGPARGNGG